MQDATKEQLRGLAEQDVEDVMVVAVGESDGGLDPTKAEIISDVPADDIPLLLGMLLVGAETALEVPAPLLAYEATKRAEKLGDVAGIFTTVDGGGLDG